MADRIISEVEAGAARREALVSLKSRKSRLVDELRIVNECLGGLSDADVQAAAGKLSVVFPGGIRIGTTITDVTAGPAVVTVVPINHVTRSPRPVRQVADVVDILRRPDPVAEAESDLKIGIKAGE